MVGFNRRFSPHVVRMKELLGRKTAPLAITYTINAGAIPASHWTQDPEIGGGRIVGEACHFVDLCRCLAGSPISRMTMDVLNDGGSGLSDSALIQLKFANGSIATIQYLANGHPGVPKERLEVFCEGSVLQLNDFRELRGHGWSRFRKLKTRRIEKGHGACLAAFFEAIKVSGEPPIPVPEIWEVSDWILKA
jgi:predicted dehydrogenase